MANNKKRPNSNQNSSDRKIKRINKVMNEKLTEMINKAVNTIIEKELVVQSDEAGEILDNQNNQWKLWLNQFAKNRKLKLTQPILDAFRRESIKYIETILSDPEKIEKIEKDEESKTSTDVK